MNVFDKDKRAQLLNDLKLLVFDPKKPENLCPYLVQLYGAYFEETDIKMILELMDVGSLQEMQTMHKLVNCTEGGFPEPVVSYILKQVGIRFARAVAALNLNLDSSWDYIFAREEENP